MPDGSTRSLAVLALALLLGCGEASEAPAPETKSAAEPAPAAAAAPLADDLPNGLLLALSTFDQGADGKPVPRSELMVLTRSGGAWQARSFGDPDAIFLWFTRRR